MATAHAFDIERATPDVSDTLRDVFGFDAFRPGQQAVVEALVAGENVLAVMPTGAGKSLCFQLPAMMMPGFAVVVSPLIALMENQVALMKGSGVAAGMIHSARSREDNVADWLAAREGRLKLLYMSPERLATPRMQAALKDLPVSLFVIDEAHCISQWGHDFRKEYMLLAQLRTTYPDVPLAAFTATADEATRADIVERVFHNDAKTFVQGFDRPNITINVEPKKNSTARLLALANQRRGSQGIVYCLSRKGTEKAAQDLCADGHNAVSYHAGLPAEERAEKLDRFLTEPDLIVCATIAFGMGIDKPDIRYVIHMNLPASMEAYYQELGRAGRDGEPAEAILFYGYGDLRTRRMMIDDTTAPDEVKRVERRRLDVLANYAEAATCRRNVLLAHFGELRDVPCGACDICQTPPTMIDGTSQAKLLMQIMQATGEIYGQAHLIDIALGKQTDKIKQARHDRLSLHGDGAATKIDQWRSIIRQLLAEGYCETSGEYGSLGVTPLGHDLTAGKAQIMVRLEEKRSTRKTRTVRKSVSGGQVDAKLLTRLKQKRLEIARAKGSPAFIVFSDRSMIDMAQKKPMRREEFAEIFGVGEKKIEAYADIFIAEIKEYSNSAS